MEPKKDNYSFIREQIKEKPFTKKRMLKEAGFVCLLGIVFGAAAFGTSKLLDHATEPQESAEAAEEFVIPADEEPVKEESADDAEAEETVTTDDVQNMISEIGTEDYQNLMEKIYDIGREANKSIVTVYATSQDYDFLNMPYENEGKCPGLILGDNGVAELIVTEYSLLKDAENLTIEYIDGNRVTAEITGYDRTRNLAVISVPLADISESTKEAIADAVLGNSYTVSEGQVVLAIGNPTGEVYSILSGTVTSTAANLQLPDGNYDVLTTDMTNRKTSSGVLINLNGEVIGYYSDTLNAYDSGDAMNAVSISSLKSLIEKLSNGGIIPNLGVEMVTVTADMETEYEIPQGVYLESVEVGSAAFDAGLRVGDVVTKIGTTKVSKTEDITKFLESSDIGDTTTIKVERYGKNAYNEVSCDATLQ